MRNAMVFLLLLIPALGYSQDQGSWEDIRQLRRGQKIQILDSSFQKTQAKLVEVSDLTLRFKAGGKEFMLPREDVAMVSVQKGSVGKRILMGILAGALLGFTTWAHLNNCEKYGCSESDGGWYEGSGKELSRKSAYVLAGVGAGAVGVLAIFAKEAGQVIYFRNPPAPYFQSPVTTGLDPDNDPILDSGNILAPLPAITELSVARDSSRLLKALYFPEQ